MMNELVQLSPRRVSGIPRAQHAAPSGRPSGFTPSLGAPPQGERRRDSGCRQGTLDAPSCISPSVQRAPQQETAVPSGV